MAPNKTEMFGSKTGPDVTLGVEAFASPRGPWDVGDVQPRMLPTLMLLMATVLAVGLVAFWFDGWFNSYRGQRDIDWLRDVVSRR